MSRRPLPIILMVLLPALALASGGCACACRGGSGGDAAVALAPAQVASGTSGATATPAPASLAPAQGAAGGTGAVGAAGAAAATPDSTTPPTPEETTLTTVGQAAPVFTVSTLGGQPFSLGAQKGKVVLVNWFATWCGPCKAEMPHLKDRVWEAFKGNPDFVMISVSREEDAAKVAPFVSERGLPWTFGLDTDRTAYGQYAEAFIPRNHVIGRDGRIVFQSEGFEEEEFAAMIAAIAGELAGR